MFLRALIPSLLGIAALWSAEDAAPVAALKKSLVEQIAANALAGDKVKAFAVKELVPLCTEAVWVAEVKAQNARKASLDEIKAIDAEWQAAESELPIQKQKTSNACAEAVKGVCRRLSVVREAFIMDDQGANVGQNTLTSDYWQGDEDKWQKSFAGGKGGVDVGKAKFDKSANTSLQQVSLPIIAEDGAVIGAVTFGIDVNGL